MPQPPDVDLAGGIIGGGADIAFEFLTANDLDGREVGGDGIWNEYLIEEVYEQDRRTYQLPLCHPRGFRGATAAFVQLAAPTLVCCVDWTAAKMGAMPEAPNPDMVAVNVLRAGGIGVGGAGVQGVLDAVRANTPWVLLDAWVEPAAPAFAADGQTPLYRLSGTYFYGHKDPADNVFEDVWWPYPANVANFDEDLPRRYPPNKLRNDLI